MIKFIVNYEVMNMNNLFEIRCSRKTSLFDLKQLIFLECYDRLHHPHPELQKHGNRKETMKHLTLAADDQPIETSKELRSLLQTGRVTNSTFKIYVEPPASSASGTRRTISNSVSRNEWF